MPKKGSIYKKVKVENENVDEPQTSTTEENIANDDKPTKFLTNQILKQQKFRHELNVHNFLKNNGIIILSF